MRLFALLLLIGSASANAQATLGAKISGVYNQATTDGTDLGDLVGAGVAGFVEVPVTANLSVEADLGYAQGGFETVSIPGFEYLDTRVRVHYFSFSPAIRTEFGGRGIRPSLFAGPRVDLRLAEMTSVGEETGPSSSYDDLAYGGALGAGIRVPLTKRVNDIRGDIRYSYLYPGGAIRHRAIEVRVGVGF